MPENGEDENLAKLHMMAAGDSLVSTGSAMGRSSHAANGEVAIGVENGSVTGELLSVS